jgi:chromosomal replication initiator protein
MIHAPIHAPVLCAHCGAPSAPAPMIAHIQATVAAYYHLDRMAMTSQRRDKSVSHPRQLAMYLCRELTPRSLPDIGRRFGNRDHTTVMHAIKAVEKRLAGDWELRADLLAIRERLGK